MTLSFSKARQLKKAPKKAVKKVKKSTLRNKADSLFSKYIRSGGICLAQGSFIKCGGSLSCAHIMTRGIIALRYEPQNAIALCMGHHRWFHQNPYEWVKFIEGKFPGRYEKLIQQKTYKVKKTEDLYRAVIARYSKEEKV